MGGSGKGGNNRRKPFKHRNWENAQSQSRDTSKHKGKKPADISPIGEGKLEKKRALHHERPKWVPPKPPALSLPEVSCIWCDKPIKDIMTAVSDPNTGKPVHFDCVMNRIAEKEQLEAGDTVSYIGGGRFGIIHYNNPPDTRDFTIKKIFEWEKKEDRSEWRITISDHFSVT